MWIFKSGFQDFYKIYLSGLLGLLIIFFSKQEDTNVIFYFFVFHLIDVGHVYSTMLRTIFDITELKREYKTLAVPILVAIVSFFWLYFKIPYFWSFVVYFTVFHNLRQGWGLVRWYEKINNKFHNNQIYYYAFTILPFLIFHLRDIKNNLIYYSPTDSVNLSFLKFNININLMSHQMEFNNISLIILTSLYVLFVLSWIYKEFAYFFKTKSKEYNRIIAMLYFSSVYAYSFLYANNSMQIFTILILSHGIPYIFIIDKFLNKKQNKNFRFFLILIIVLGSLLNLGLEDFYLDGIFNYTVVAISFMEYFLTLVYISPILSHFIWDMYLWKKDHPDSKLIY